MQKTILTLIIAYFTLLTSAQDLEKYDLNADTISYSLYLKGDWKALIKLKPETEFDGINFYFLQLRYAYAYYYTGEYRHAVFHFEKANTLYPLDDYVKTDYCNALWYSGYFITAGKILNELPKTSRETLKINFEEPLILASISSGYQFNENYKTLINSIAKEEKSRSFNFPRNMTFTTLSALHRPAKRFTFFESLTYYDINKTTLYNPEGMQKTLQDNKIMQGAFFCSGSWLATDRLIVSPAIHIAAYTSNYLDYNISSYKSDSSVYRNPPAPPVKTYTYRDTAIFENKTYSKINFLASLNLTYRFVSFDVFAETGYSNSNLQNQTWFRIGFTNYVNPQFYYFGSFTYHSNFNSNLTSYFDNNIYSAGFAKKTGNTWLSAAASYGYMWNYSEINGLAFYNGQDALTMKGTISANFPLYKKNLWATISYKLANFTSYDFYYDESNNLRDNFIFYETGNLNNTITADLIWYF